MEYQLKISSSLNIDIIVRLLKENLDADKMNEIERFENEGRTIIRSVNEIVATRLNHVLTTYGAVVEMSIMKSEGSEIFLVRLLYAGGSLALPIQVIMDIIGLEFEEARRIVDNLGVVAENLNMIESMHIKNELEKVGAVANIEEMPSIEPQPKPEPQPEPQSELPINQNQIVLYGKIILENNSIDQLIKLGNLAIHNGSDARDADIKRANKTDGQEYALKHDPSGDTTINIAKNKTLIIKQNGVNRFKIHGNGNIELTPNNDISLYGNTSIGTKDKACNLFISGNLKVLGEIDGKILHPSADSRIKKDVLPFKEGIKRLLALEPVTFKFNGKGETLDNGEKHIGLIAQEVQKIFPEMTHTHLRKLNPTDAQETEILTFDYKSLTFVLINAIKELSSRLERLEKEHDK